MVRTHAYGRIAIVFCAFALPFAALFFFHFVSGLNSGMELAIVATLALAAIGLAAKSAYGLLFRFNELEGMIEGIRKTRNVIEYTPDGTILSMNGKSLDLLGYTAEQCVGHRHSMFVDPEYAASAEYREFWIKLGRGAFIEHRYRRKAAGGRDIWVLNNYTPVHDLNGKLCKVVNWMTDLTAAHREQDEVVHIMGAALKKVSAGDLTTRIENKLDGGYDELRQDFNAALDRLHDTIHSVARDAASISNGAGEISQAADDLSHRTEQQAASLEETAAALEEITATVKQTAANAKEARNSVTEAKAAAEDGGRVVETAVHAMDSISQSSKQITDIIGVIDEIAFQTNLLALNAGVEAARAGEAGRGFAVVASEVRALAQRSGEAAKQIKTLIQDSGEHVAAGVKFVAETGEALKQIVERVTQINALVGEMALAAEQQSTGIEEVNAAVGQMDRVTQQNAAMVEESTAASRQLASEAQSLSQVVSFFHVAHEEDIPRIRSVAPTPRHNPANTPKPRVTGNVVALKPQESEEDWAEF